MAGRSPPIGARWVAAAALVATGAMIAWRHPVQPPPAPTGVEARKPAPLAGREARSGAGQRAPRTRREAVRPPVLVRLEDAIDRADGPRVRRLAGRLRGALREDPRLLAAVGRLVLDPRESDRLRGTLALVLGTLDRQDARQTLVDALRDRRSGGELAIWLVYALGAWNGRSDFDARFGFDPDGPWVVESPTGLRLPICTRVRDPDVLELVEQRLREPRDDRLRRAALDVLRHSLELDRVRGALLGALHAESDPHTQAACAEALGEWTLTADAGHPQASTVRARLLSLVPLPDSEVLRLRIEPILRSRSLTAGEAEAVASWFDASAGDFGFRYFAIGVAGEQALPLLQDPATRRQGERLHGLLVRTLLSETDAKLREIAAGHLEHIPGELSERSLIAAAERDPAWHVRLVAVQALAARDAGGPEGRAREVLARLAALDRDPRVRAAARTAL